MIAQQLGLLTTNKIAAKLEPQSEQAATIGRLSKAFVCLAQSASHLIKAALELLYSIIHCRISQFLKKA